MLTRRHIRVKVMQSIYAIHQSDVHNLQKEEKFLLNSMENTQGLYLTLMSLWIELYERAKEMDTLAKHKFLLNSKDLSINKKFIDNKVLKLIVENESLQESIADNCPINWRAHNEYVSLIYNKILESEIYQTYLTKPNEFNIDKYLLVDLYSEIIAPNEKLFEFIADEAITWEDDIPIINTLIIKILKGIRYDNSKNYLIPSLFKAEEDKEFGIQLLRKSVLNDEKYHEYVVEKTPKWDSERIALLDIIMIKMAITEFLKFPSIPIKVTLNEYLEIAKEYSTPKSSVFINGILDILSKDFIAQNLAQKIGRGLY
ncbi:MAG: transcription antitermination factor NusB [Capnocytophaga sp.]|nr:transcription antitermination factor NusB [Capnocytophaga sp.]